MKIYYYWLCAGITLLSMGILHAGELADDLSAKPKRLYMQVSRKDEERITLKKRVKRTRAQHTPSLSPTPEKRLATQEDSPTAAPQTYAPLPPPEKGFAYPQVVPFKSLADIHPLQTPPAKYAVQQAAVRQAILAQLKADYKKLIKNRTDAQKQQQKLTQLRYAMADKMLAYLQSKGYNHDSQQDLNQLKENCGDDSHLFFDLIIQVVEDCDLKDKERDYIYSSFIQPVEELDDNTEPIDDTADVLLKLIEKTKRPCPCLITREPCAQCDAVNLKELDNS